ncbi:TlpA family protein disulfide reductase [Sphaerisporangium fuscum]|uniref:TlpA family protein disulfide reductase n=1 Tax=Sphaerisporangium fuscum TaxID=2835868 RepID=UPI001BDDBA7B|nr:thioredoxin family protein [Sphaerisporangium fuscum]
MERVIAVVLVVACVALTVAFLACLRGIAELRLRLTGRGIDPSAQLVLGRKLPESLIRLIPDVTRDTLVIFMSSTCSTCHGLASDLDKFAGRQVVAMIAGDSTAELRAMLPAHVDAYDGEQAKAVDADLPMALWPTVILQRDGFMVATATGSDADSAADLEVLWEQRLDVPEGTRA